MGTATARRRIASPDRFIDLPTPSRAAIEDAGFALIEDRQPSFLLGGVLLVTGEVPRTTAFETGLPAAMPQAHRPNSVGSRFELKAAPERNVA
jgi:7,8-dihydropterin-6-yl-methyl-4-(beta-D-ribofuranosyl)aminobenzene 5'-phosphate synthase